MSTIILARGHVTKADELTVELVQATETPGVILIRWPAAPSVTDPHRFQSVANSVMEVLAAAVAKLATIGDGERWP